MTKTLETWYRSNSVMLVRASWTGAPDEDIWTLLLRVLHALASTQTVLESLRGRVNVAWRGEPAHEPELWPIERLPGGLAALRGRAGGGSWEPTSAVLCGDVDLLLPDDIAAVETADWEADEDRECAVPMPLETRTDRLEASTRMRTWKALCTSTAVEEDGPVYLDLTCDSDEQPVRLWLDARSRYELWRPWTIDDDGPVPCGSLNLERLRQGLVAVADVTGGIVRLPDEMVAELEKASGRR